MAGLGGRSGEAAAARKGDEAAIQLQCVSFAFKIQSEILFCSVFYLTYLNIFLVYMEHAVFDKGYDLFMFGQILL